MKTAAQIMKNNQMKRLIAFPFICALIAGLTIWI